MVKVIAADGVVEVGALDVVTYGFPIRAHGRDVHESVRGGRAEALNGDVGVDAGPDIKTKAEFLVDGVAGGLVELVLDPHATGGRGHPGPIFGCGIAGERAREQRVCVEGIG